MPMLSWRHHTLIQALLSRGPLTQEEFHSIFSHVTGKSAGSHQQLFNDYLRKINEELAYVHLELRACRNQYDANVYYGVVNNVSDDQSKLGTRYTVPQIAFYKGIIEAIIRDAAAQGNISNIDALNIRLDNQVPTGTESQPEGVSTHIPPALKNFTLSQKEKTLEELVRDKWLCLSSDGTIGLGVRSFLDLRSWFRSNEVPACEVCNEAAVKAELCKSEACTVRIHQYCLKKKFSQRKVDRVCPGCGTQWQYLVTKAEAVEEEDPSGPSQNSQLQPSMRKRPRSSQGIAEESVGCSSSLTSTPISDTRRATRSSTRLRSVS